MHVKYCSPHPVPPCYELQGARTAQMEGEIQHLARRMGQKRHRKPSCWEGDRSRLILYMHVRLKKVPFAEAIGHVKVLLCTIKEGAACFSKRKKASIGSDFWRADILCWNWRCSAPQKLHLTESLRILPREAMAHIHPYRASNPSESIVCLGSPCMKGLRLAFSLTECMERPYAIGGAAPVVSQLSSDASCPSLAHATSAPHTHPLASHLPVNKLKLIRQVGAECGCLELYHHHNCRQFRLKNSPLVKLLNSDPRLVLIVTCIPSPRHRL